MLLFLKYSLIFRVSEMRSLVQFFLVSKMRGIHSLAFDYNCWKLGNGGGHVWLSLLQRVRMVVEIF